jgi:hypothetical protein
MEFLVVGIFSFLKKTIAFAIGMRNAIHMKKFYYELNTMGAKQYSGKLQTRVENIPIPKIRLLFTNSTFFYGKNEK